MGIRFRIYDTVFTFVNSHLAAFDEMVERRNADYNELRKYLKFPEPAAVPAQEDALNTGVHHSGVFESDYAFWFVSFALLLVDTRKLTLNLGRLVILYMLTG